jgi:hypothetical protein
MNNKGVPTGHATKGKKIAQPTIPKLPAKDAKTTSSSSLIDHVQHKLYLKDHEMPNPLRLGKQQEDQIAIDAYEWKNSVGIPH